MLVSCFDYSSTLMTEATFSSEKPINFQRSTRRYVTKNRNFHNHRCKYLRVYKSVTLLALQNLLFDFEEGGSKFLRNVRKLLPDCKMFCKSNKNSIIRKENALLSEKKRHRIEVLTAVIMKSFVSWDSTRMVGWKTIGVAEKYGSPSSGLKN
jgi:hypothetical protein